MRGTWLKLLEDEAELGSAGLSPYGKRDGRDKNETVVEQTNGHAQNRPVRHLYGEEYRSQETDEPIKFPAKRRGQTPVDLGLNYSIGSVVCSWATPPACHSLNLLQGEGDD